MRADLSLGQSPPFSVPARFLITAPLFGLAAALALLWYGPSVISHRWTPELLAITHLLTLGFIAMSMLGAMMQLLPVLMGVVIPSSPMFSALIHIGLITGCTALSLAWLLDIRPFFTASMLLLGFSLGLFSLVAAERLLRSSSRHVTRSMMLLACAGLAITTALGLQLALGHARIDIALQRELTDLHLGWGLAGWVLMLVVAVAYQVIPMFQITDEYPALHRRWLGWSLFIALVLLSLSFVAPFDFLRTPAQWLLGICGLVFALATLWILHHRRRQLPDITLNFWRLAMLALLMAFIVQLYTLLSNTQPAVLILGVLIIHGFAMTAINGMMYKIIPFIIWLHLSAGNKTLRDSGKREAQVKVPHMRKIIPEKTSQWQFRVHTFSLLMLLMAIIFPNIFYYPAALALVIAQGMLFILLINAARLYNRLRNLQATG